MVLAKASSSSSANSFALSRLFSTLDDHFVKVKRYFLIKFSALVLQAYFPPAPYLMHDLGVTLNLPGLESLSVIELQYFLTLPKGQDDKLIHTYVALRYGS